jgi:hypothetical protein
MFSATPAAEAENLDHRLRQVKSVGNVPGQLFEIDEITLDVLHHLAARTHEVMMRFKIAIHQQGGSMGRNLSQQSALNKKPQIVVNGGERNRWNAASDRSVNAFWGMVTVGSDDGLINHLTLVRDRQTVLRRQFAELFMREAHSYRIRMIIKRRRAVSTESFPAFAKRAAESINPGQRDGTSGDEQRSEIPSFRSHGCCFAVAR